jgi:hypothetical protein
MLDGGTILISLGGGRRSGEYAWLLGQFHSYTDHQRVFWTLEERWILYRRGEQKKKK